MALRPSNPDSRHGQTEKARTSREGLSNRENVEDPEIDPDTQPNGNSGVTEDGFADDRSDHDGSDHDRSVNDGPGDLSEEDDMATLAVNPDLAAGGFGSDSQIAVPKRSTAGFAGMEDAEIMLKLSAGDMSAFDFLLAKYRRPIVHFMYRMVHNEAVAEELAQEVFLRVYRSRETYRAEARFSTWLYRIATNLGVNHARDTRHERAASTVYLDEPDDESGSTPDVADLTPSAEANILRRERMAAIREHVMALPERQQMAVLMHKYEGMDYKQIGDVLKLSESATKSLLFRAYQTLREKLKPFI